MQKNLCRTLASFLLLSMVWLLIPDQTERGKISYAVNHLKPEEVIPDAQAAAEAGSIQAEAMRHFADYTPELAYAHLKRLVFLQSHLGPDSPMHANIEAALAYLDSVRLRQFDYAGKFRDKMSKLTRSGEYQEISSFYAVTYEWSWKELGSHFSRSYPSTLPLAIAFFVCMLKLRGFKLRYVILTPLKFASAVTVWPVGFFVYPTSDPAKQVQNAFRSLSYALSFFISVALPNLAKAQAPGQQETRPDNLQAEQLDPVPTADPPPSKVVLKVDIFGDEFHERQLVLGFSYGNFALINQERAAAGNTAAFSYTGFGLKLKPVEGLSVTATFGPQLNLLTNKVDYTTAFVNWVYRNKGLTATFLNRLAFGLEGTKTLASDRHFQMVTGIPGLPSWLGVDAEEKHVVNTGAWTELFVGPVINIGGVFGKPKSWLRDFSIYPYWDFAGHWDVRVWYSHAFAFP